MTRLVSSSLWFHVIFGVSLSLIFSFLGSPKILYAQESVHDTCLDASFEIIDNGNIRIFLNSDFFAEYRANYKGTPIVWPICGPNGSLVTRAWPMINEIDVEGESDPMMRVVYQNAVISERNGTKDHPHHRSFWFNHGNVNNGDFWSGSHSTIRQSRLVSVETHGQSVTIVTENFWNHDKLERDICRDVRTLVFSSLPGRPDVRCIDFSIEIFALEDNVVFGDTKEGSFGIRVPTTMALTSKKITKNWGGTISDNLGNIDGETWSKKAKWVNYVGPVARFLEGNELSHEYAKDSKNGDFPLDKAGIAVLNGPNSLDSIPWRHVRDYGLFSSNPFGQKDFEPHNPNADGSQKLNKGESMKFNFRVLFHNGDLTEEAINKAYETFNNLY